jgi:hypothetical protein
MAAHGPGAEADYNGVSEAWGDVRDVVFVNTTHQNRAQTNCEAELKLTAGVVVFNRCGPEGSPLASRPPARACAYEHNLHALSCIQMRKGETVQQSGIRIQEVRRPNSFLR